MKSFNLEAAKAGASIQARNGLTVEVLKYNVNNPNFPLLGVINGVDGDFIGSWTNEGHYINPQTPSGLDLMMASTKKTGWINIYKDTPKDGEAETSLAIYSSREEAYTARTVWDYTDTIQIEWEE